MHPRTALIPLATAALVVCAALLGVAVGVA